jgi:hypothetical protein
MIAYTMDDTGFYPDLGSAIFYSTSGLLQIGSVDRDAQVEYFTMEGGESRWLNTFQLDRTVDMLPVMILYSCHRIPKVIEGQLACGNIWQQNREFVLPLNDLAIQLERAIRQHGVEWRLAWRDDQVIKLQRQIQDIALDRFSSGKKMEDLTNHYLDSLGRGSPLNLFHVATSCHETKIKTFQGYINSPDRNQYLKDCK